MLWKIAQYEPENTPDGMRKWVFKRYLDEEELEYYRPNPNGLGVQELVHTPGGGDVFWAWKDCERYEFRIELDIEYADLADLC